MFDRETWTLRLHQSAAKTGKGRALVLTGPLRTIIERRLKARRLDTPLVFHRTAKGRPGQPVKDFRKAWAQACIAVGLTPGRRGGLTFHDTRRTAVRNLIRAGVDQTVAKKISGHRTDSTFDRYNITSEDDLRDAVEKVAAYVETLPTERTVAVMGESGPNTDQRPPKTFRSDAELTLLQQLRGRTWRKRVGIESTQASRTGADGVDGVDQSTTCEPRSVDGADPADPEEGE